MKHLLFAATLIAACIATAQSIESPVDTEQKPWNNLEVNNNPDDFQFIIVTDRTGGHRPGVFMDGVRKINLIQPEFVMSVGDLIEGYTEDRDELDREWTEFIGFIDQLEVPFFYIPGNHDITNAIMEEEWRKRFGPTYYHFRYRDVLFLCLNSEDPPSTQMSAEQIAYMKKALDDNKDVRWTLVFIHKPLWAYGDTSENGWDGMDALLKGRPHTVYAGHTHRYFQHDRNDQKYIVLATMGGGSQLRGPNYGEFDHFMWVTMTDDGPRMANLMLNGIWDTDIMNEERGAIIRPALAGATVRTDGIVVDSPTFTGASTTLRVTNDADIPMDAEITLVQDGPVGAADPVLSATVDPNSVETFEVALASEFAVDTSSIAPIVAKWHLRYEIPGDIQPIDLRGQHRIIIDHAFQAISTADDIDVDGSIEDWGSLRIVPAGWGQIQGHLDSYNGVFDAALRMDVRYDSEYVYIAADVNDEAHLRDRRPEFWRQDSLMISLDARPEKDRHGGEANVDFLQVGIIPEVDDGGIPERENLPEDLLSAVEKRDGGFIYEVAIPVSYLNGKQGGSWQSFRLNITQIDRDRDGTLRYSWRPLWDSAENFANSGTFRKQ